MEPNLRQPEVIHSATSQMATRQKQKLLECKKSWEGGLPVLAELNIAVPPTAADLPRVNTLVMNLTHQVQARKQSQRYGHTLHPLGPLSLSSIVRHSSMKVKCVPQTDKILILSKMQILLTASLLVVLELKSHQYQEKGPP